MWDMTIHPLRGPTFSLTLIAFFNQCGLPPNPPPLGPSVLTGTPPRVYPFWGIARSLTHRPVSGSDTICNSQVHLSSKGKAQRGQYLLAVDLGRYSQERGRGQGLGI